MQLDRSISTSSFNITRGNNNYNWGQSRLGLVAETGYVHYVTNLLLTHLVLYGVSYLLSSTQLYADKVSPWK